MLVSENTKICVTPNANAKICVTPTVNPQREQVEFRSDGSSEQNSCVGHVYFMSFMSISFALGPVLQWNMGYRVIYHFDSLVS